LVIALDPNQTCEIKLALEAGEHRFLCRYLTCREHLGWQARLQPAMDEKDDPKALQCLCAALGGILTGWTGFDTAFSLEALQDALTPGEMWELAFAIPNATRLSEQDKKKSYWQSQSAGAKAVSTTEQPAAASIPPVPPAP
jgi:hypothetical protein